MVVVLAETNEMCMIRNPRTLKAKARFNTKAETTKEIGDICFTGNKVVKASKEHTHQMLKRWLQVFQEFQGSLYH